MLRGKVGEGGCCSWLFRAAPHNSCLEEGHLESVDSLKHSSICCSFEGAWLSMHTYKFLFVISWGGVAYGGKNDQLKDDLWKVHNKSVSTNAFKNRIWIFITHECFWGSCSQIYLPNDSCLVVALFNIICMHHSPLFNMADLLWKVILAGKRKSIIFGNLNGFCQLAWHFFFIMLHSLWARRKIGNKLELKVLRRFLFLAYFWKPSEIAITVFISKCLVL